MDEMAYEVNGPDCGRDKNGVFHCVCGKCRPIGFLRGHMKQAENFREAGWTITQENRGRYIEELCKRAKKNIDKAGITAYNVRDISKYAKINYDTERYDEVEAEYMATTKGK